MILVVGATGQLGTALVRRLARAGLPVRAFVRPASRYQHLKGDGPELAFGDLRSPESVAAACQGVDVVLATANATVRGRGDTFEQSDGLGYRNLIAACQRQRVPRIAFASVPVTPYDGQVPTFHYKRLVEDLLQSSGLGYTVWRASFFMDDWLALIGSSIPLHRAEAHTLERPFWFSRGFMGLVGHMVENRGLALVPGSGNIRHAFIALDDVAEFMVRGLGSPRTANAILEIGGPQVLSWDEAVATFERVLGRRVKAVHTPAAVFRIAQLALTPLSPAAANLMGLNYIAATVDTAWDARGLAAELGVPLTSVEAFLRARV